MAKSTKFQGTVIERSANGSGVVEITSPAGPAGSEHKLGVFSIDVVHTPEVSKVAKVGHRVEGVAVPFGDNYKILRIEP